MSKRRGRPNAGMPAHARSTMTMAALCLATGSFNDLRLHYTELVSLVLTMNREDNHTWN
jgi:hypothetical protein